MASLLRVGSALRGISRSHAAEAYLKRCPVLSCTSWRQKSSGTRWVFETKVLKVGDTVRAGGFIKAIGLTSLCSSVLVITMMCSLKYLLLQNM